MGLDMFCRTGGNKTSIWWGGKIDGEINDIWRGS